MAYFICTTEKYHKGEINGIERENERVDGYKSEDRHIDFSRTKDNYHTIDPLGKYSEVIDKRVESLELSRSIRKDAVYMLSVVVTASQAFFDSLSGGEEKDFFTDATNVLAQRFGRINTISAVVHKDESHPHLHFNFVPITDDGRLCAKDVLTGERYETVLEQLYCDIGAKWGLQKGDLASGLKKTSMTKYSHTELVDRVSSIADKIDEQTRKQQDEYYKREARMELMRIEERRLEESNEEKRKEREKLDRQVGELQHFKGELETERTKPVPRRKRKDQIVSYRVALLSLQKENDEKDDDYAFLDSMYRKLQVRLKETDESAKMAELVMNKFPDEFLTLWERAQTDDKIFPDDKKNKR